MSQFYMIDTSQTPIPDDTWVEIIASTSNSVYQIQFLYCSPVSTDYGLVKLAIGAEGEEEFQLISAQRQSIPFNIYIPGGSRVSVQSIGQDLTSGMVLLSLIE